MDREEKIDLMVDAMLEGFGHYTGDWPSSTVALKVARHMLQAIDPEPTFVDISVETTIS